MNTGPLSPTQLSNKLSFCKSAAHILLELLPDLARATSYQEMKTSPKQATWLQKDKLILYHSHNVT